MTALWIIGSGGLLGAGLVRTLRPGVGRLFVPGSPFDWSNGLALREQMTGCVEAFARCALETGGWEIYWAAGVGTMGSSEADMAQETAAWSHLLARIGANPVLSQLSGRIVLASSAGAVYSGCRSNVIDERCEVSATTPYGHAKLVQERMLEDFVAPTSRVTALVGRISTLYGPDQASGRRPGLIAHMARSIVRRRPIQVFVPFDTVRDYIIADDAAAKLVHWARTALPGLQTRIVASETPTSIAEIVGTFRRVARRQPLISTSASQLSALYSRRVEYRSLHPIRGATIPQTCLLTGIAQVLAAERLAYASQGRSLRRTVSAGS